MNNPPFKPDNPSPSDGSADVSEDADLSWMGGDLDAEDTVIYDVYLGEIDIVTIDLSPIGGSYEAQMTNIPGTDTWTITTNAVEGINIAHDLIVTATDINGNSDSSVSIQLTVLRRGDVDHDNAVDKVDALAIRKYTKGLAPDPGVFIGDLYPATGDNLVDEQDASYLREYVRENVDEP